MFQSFDMINWLEQMQIAFIAWEMIWNMFSTLQQHRTRIVWRDNETKFYLPSNWNFVCELQSGIAKYIFIRLIFHCCFQLLFRVCEQVSVSQRKMQSIIWYFQGNGAHIPNGSVSNFCVSWLDWKRLPAIVRICSMS